MSLTCQNTFTHTLLHVLLSKFKWIMSKTNPSITPACSSYHVAWLLDATTIHSADQIKAGQGTNPEVLLDSFSWHPSNHQMELVPPPNCYFFLAPSPKVFCLDHFSRLHEPGLNFSDILHTMVISCFKICWCSDTIG